MLQLLLEATPTAPLYRPGPHVLTVPFTQNAPAGHTVHDGAPADEYVPTGHATHVAGDVADVEAEYVPAGHNVAAAGVVQYAPAGHAEQLEEPAADSDPLEHAMQAEGNVAFVTVL